MPARFQCSTPPQNGGTVTSLQNTWLFFFFWHPRHLLFTVRAALVRTPTGRTNEKRSCGLLTGVAITTLAELGLIGTWDVARLAVPRSEATSPSVANQCQAAVWLFFLTVSFRGSLLRSFGLSANVICDWLLTFGDRNVRSGSGLASLDR